MVFWCFNCLHRFGTFVLMLFVGVARFVCGEMVFWIALGGLLVGYWLLVGCCLFWFAALDA